MIIVDTYYQSVSGIGLSFRCRYIDDNDCKSYTKIALGSYGVDGPYFMILGVSVTYNSTTLEKSFSEC